MEGELEQIPAQCGVAILDLLDGKILKLTGEFDNDIGKSQCERLYRIILDCGRCIEDDQVRRISVSYLSYRFVMTTAKQQLYIVKILGNDATI